MCCLPRGTALIWPPHRGSFPCSAREAFGRIFDALGVDSNSILAAVQTTVDLIDTSINGWVLIIDGLIEAVRELNEFLQRQSVPTVEEVKEAVTKPAEEFKKEYEEKGFLSLLKDVIGFAGVDPVLADPVFQREFLPSPSSNNTTTNDVKIDVKVEGGNGTPADIGKAVGDALSSLFRNGLENETVVVKV